jgi:hypothetical protein
MILIGRRLCDGLANSETNSELAFCIFQITRGEDTACSIAANFGMEIFRKNNTQIF